MHPLGALHQGDGVGTFTTRPPHPHGAGSGQDPKEVADMTDATRVAVM